MSYSEGMSPADYAAVTKTMMMALVVAMELGGLLSFSFSHSQDGEMETEAVYLVAVVLLEVEQLTIMY